MNSVTKASTTGKSKIIVKSVAFAPEAKKDAPERAGGWRRYAGKAREGAKKAARGIAKLALAATGTLARMSPVGRYVAVCAVGGAAGYAAGAALGHYLHPITPVYKAGNKIRKKQPDGKHKWVPGPKPTPDKTPTKAEIRSNPYKQAGTKTQRQHNADFNTANGQTVASPEGEIARRKLERQRAQNPSRGGEVFTSSSRPSQAEINKMTREERLRRYCDAIAAHNKTISIRRATGATGPDPTAPVPSDFGL
jgi:hypothetical protein